MYRVSHYYRTILTVKIHYMRTFLTAISLFMRPFLSNSFKNYIVTQTQDRKMLSNTVVPRDPIYMAFGLGIGDAADLSLDILDQTKLYAVRETNNKMLGWSLVGLIITIIFIIITKK